MSAPDTAGTRTMRERVLAGVLSVSEGTEPGEASTRAPARAVRTLDPAAR